MRRYERPAYILIVVLALVMAAGSTLLAQSGESIWRIAEQSDDRIVLERDAVIVEPTETGEPEPTSTSTPVPTATAEADPTATATIEPTPTHDHGGDVSTRWHAPTTHEHGHAPPQWAEDWSMQKFGHGVIYGGDEATPNENELKHNAYKGQIVPSKAGGEAYVRFHAQSNPHGRMAQFHSYELYYLDSAGNVSFLQGWLDCGNPDSRRFPRSQGDPGTRPGMLVVDQAAWDRGIRTEQWYCFGAGARLFEMGVNIGNTSTIWHPGEQYNDPHDMDTWDVTGATATNRLVDFFLIERRFHGVTGDFELTPMGTLPGVGDVALLQHIAPTFYNDMRTEFGVRRISGLSQVNHAAPGLTLPN